MEEINNEYQIVFGKNENWTCGCLYTCNDCTRLEKENLAKNEFFSKKDLDYLEDN